MFGVVLYVMSGDWLSDEEEVEDYMPDIVSHAEEEEEALSRPRKGRRNRSNIAQHALPTAP